MGDELWNDQVKAEWAKPDSKAYLDAVLEQYKLYVEMADRISQRRAVANTFFLTVNTAILTAVGVFWKDRPEADAVWLAVPLAVALGQCAVWWLLLLSYRQLNTAKYQVVGRLEERLPASPYWRAEWSRLGEGKDITKYFPLTHVERWIPVLFALAYIGGAIIVLTAG